MKTGIIWTASISEVFARVLPAGKPPRDIRGRCWQSLKESFSNTVEDS